MQCRFVCPLGLSTSLLLGSAPAQCALDVTTGPGIAGLDNLATMTRWDPDGSGPAAELVVFAGAFRVAGSLLVEHIATYDPVTGAFGALGGGLDGAATAITVTANNDLVVIGNFQTAGGMPARGVARWNGTSWAAFGTGFAPYPDTDLRAVAELPNGDIVVGGSFWSNSAVYSGLARWDGATWSAIPGLVPQAGYPTVLSLLTLPNGDLLVGGNFTTAGGMTVNGLARWDGSSWHATGGGVTFSSGSAGSVFALVQMPDGSIAVGGQFEFAGGFLANHIARWTGSAWYGLNAGAQPGGFSRVFSASVAPSGDLVIAGSFQAAGGLPTRNIARWNGSTWHGYGDGVPYAAASVLALAADDVLLSGGFASQVPHRWNGTAWRALRPGFLAASANPTIPTVLLQRADGTFVVGANYSDGAAEASTFAFAFDGTNWSPLGSGLSGAIYCGVELPNGDIVVGGNFALAPSGQFLARWDGASWSRLGGASPNGYVTGLVLLPNGDLVAVGVFSSIGGMSASRVARWDGTSWSPLGAGLDSSVGAVAVLPDGALVVAGQFTHAGGVAANRIARWDGSQWSPLGGGLDAAGGDLAVLPDGALVVSGLFGAAGGVPASRIARWDGQQWSALGTGFTQMVEALAVLPNGDLVAGGRFDTAGGVPAAKLARWDGSAWSGLTGLQLDGDVFSLFTAPAGELLVGGTFLTFGAAPTAFLFTLATTCPSLVTSIPANCVTGGGTLATPSGAWTGGTFRSTASDLPGSAAVFVAYGFAQATLPLAAVFPTAAAGCTLLLAPEVVALALTTTGAAVSQFDLPATPSLAGTVFHHQMVPVNLDGSLAVTATNALTVTVGSF